MFKRIFYDFLVELFNITDQSPPNTQYSKSDAKEGSNLTVVEILIREF